MGDSPRQAAMSLLTVLVLSEMWPWLSLPPARGSRKEAYQHSKDRLFSDVR
jgi:hypothetical protein